MREKFKQQLEEMYRQMVIMGSLCQQAIAVAVRTLDEEEDRAEKLEAQVFAVDGEIDDMEREIEALCTKLLLKQQPVAADLRRITTALKMVTDLERIGDQASDIAELARFIRKGGAHSHLKQMAAEVIRMVSESVDAFVRLDLDQAREVIAYDDVVDRWFDQIKKELVSQIAADSTAGEELLDVFLVAKYLERMGDQAADIADLSLRLEAADYGLVSKHLPAMVANVKTMVKDAIRAFIERDTETAETFEQRDDLIDAFFERVKREVIEFLKKDGDKSDVAVDVLMVAKYLERIADHAVNVCEWTEFSDTGAVGNVMIL